MNGQRPALIINEIQFGLPDPKKSIFLALAGIAAMSANRRKMLEGSPEDCIAAADREAHRVIVNHQLRMHATITDKDAVIAAPDQNAPLRQPGQVTDHHTCARTAAASFANCQCFAAGPIRFHHLGENR